MTHTQIDQAMVSGLATSFGAKADSSAVSTGLDGKVDTAGHSVSDVTGSRVLGTSYQNTAARRHRTAYVTVSPAASAIAAGELSSDGTTWIIVAEHSNQDRRTIMLVVPPGWFYRVRMTAGTATLNRWSEVQ